MIMSLSIQCELLKLSSPVQIVIKSLIIKCELLKFSSPCQIVIMLLAIENLILKLSQSLSDRDYFTQKYILSY